MNILPSWAEEHIIIPFILQVVQCHLKLWSLVTCGTATVVVVMVVMDVRSMMCVTSLPWQPFLSSIWFTLLVLEWWGATPHHHCCVSAGTSRNHQTLWWMVVRRLEELEFPITVHYNPCKSWVSNSKIYHSIANKLEWMYASKVKIFSASKVLGTTRKERVLWIWHHLWLEGLVWRQGECYLPLCRSKGDWRKRWWHRWRGCRHTGQRERRGNWCCWQWGLWGWRWVG